MRPKVKFKRSFVYRKTLGHLQESPDLFNFTLQGPRFIGAGWAITPPIISRGIFFSFCIHTSSCNLCVKSNVPIKHNANFLLSHVFVSIYDWNRVHSFLGVPRSFNVPVSVRVFLNLFGYLFDCFIYTIVSLDYQIYAAPMLFPSVDGQLALQSTINESFDQPSFIAYNKNLESVLANFLNDDQISSQIKFVQEDFAEDIEFYYLLPRLEIFKVLMKGKPNWKFFWYIKWSKEPCLE